MRSLGVVVVFVALRALPCAAAAPADSAVAAARVTMLARARVAAEQHDLDSLGTRVYIEIVRESFMHTLDDELDAAELAEELRVPPEAVRRALFAMRAEGLGDASVLAHDDPLTIAEAMDAAWVRSLSTSDRCIVRHALASRDCALDRAQRACGERDDAAQRVRLACVLLAQRALVAERGRRTLALGALTARQRVFFARAHRRHEESVITTQAVARRARTSQMAAEELLRVCADVGLARRMGHGFIWSAD